MSIALISCPTLPPQDAGTSHKPDPIANRESLGAIDGAGEDR